MTQKLVVQLSQLRYAQSSASKQPQHVHVADARALLGLQVLSLLALLVQKYNLLAVLVQK
jgi:hypothetical protein